MFSSQTIVYHSNLSDINTIEDLYGKSVATAKDWASDQYLKKFPQIKRKYYSTTNELLDAVMEKEAHATIVNNAIAQYNINKLGLIDLKTNGVIKFNSDKSNPGYHFATLKDNTLLISILNKALQNLTPNTKKQLVNKWLGNNEIKNNAITLEEEKYLKNNHFNVYINKWEPFSSFDYSNNGELLIEGMAIDVFHLLTKELQINYTFKPVEKFTDILNAIKNDPNGVTLSTSKTKDKKNYATYTKIYNSFPIAIKTKKDKSFVSSLNDIQGQTIAVGKNFSAHKILKAHYPHIKLRLVSNTIEALDLVNQGKVYGAADILPVISYISHKYDYENLKISAITQENYDIQIVTNKQSQKLVDILNKQLINIDKKHIKEINQKWINPKIIEERLNWEVIFIAIIIVIFIVSFLSYRQFLLSKEKHKFELLLQNATDGIHILDKNGNLIDCSDSFAKLLGYTKEEILKLNVKDWDISISNDALVKIIKELLINPKSFETQHKTKDGKIIDVQINASGIKLDGQTYLYASSRDITEQKEKEKIILTQKEEFESMFHSSKDGIAILDLESRFLNCNKAYEEMIGYSLEELQEKTCIELTIEEERDRSIEALSKALEIGFLENFEKVCIAKDGRRININMTATLLPDKKSFLVITKNVTTLKLIEDQSRLASMGEMIGNIAHQWRQPLSMISTASTGILYQQEMGLLNDNLIKKQMNTINDNAQYLSRTIDDFRDFIKGDTLFTNMYISEVIEGALNIVGPSLKNNYIQIHLDIDDDFEIFGSKNELEQALINIINNSKDAIVENNKDNGHITISTTIIDTYHFELSIFDNGRGIPEDIIEKIFDPYYTTKHQSKGTGLGLSMTDKIIRERHGQNIQAYNDIFVAEGKEYKGACFTISFKSKH